MEQTVDDRLEKLLTQYEDPTTTKAELEEIEQKIRFLKSLKK